MAGDVLHCGGHRDGRWRSCVFCAFCCCRCQLLVIFLLLLSSLRRRSFLHLLDPLLQQLRLLLLLFLHLLLFVLWHFGRLEEERKRKIWVRPKLKCIFPPSHSWIWWKKIVFEKKTYWFGCWGCTHCGIKQKSQGYINGWHMWQILCLFVIIIPFRWLSWFTPSCANRPLHWWQQHGGSHTRNASC